MGVGSVPQDSGERRHGIWNWAAWAARGQLLLRAWSRVGRQEGGTPEGSEVKLPGLGGWWEARVWLEWAEGAVSGLVSPALVGAEGGQRLLPPPPRSLSHPL